MWIKVERRTGALQKGDGAWDWVFTALGFGFRNVVIVNRLRDDLVDAGSELAIAVEPVAHGYRERGHKLPVRRHRQHVLGQMSGSFSHAFGATGRTETTFFAAERNNHLVAARFAHKSDEAMREYSTTHIGIELVCDVLRQRPAFSVPFRNERRKVLLEYLVTSREFRATPLVGARRFF